MKVLLLLYDIQDMGGIINTQEALYQGFLELGHKVAVRRLEWKLEATKTKEDLTPGGEVEPSLLGGTMDQRYGNRTIKHFAYKGKENLKRWYEFASKFDLIIWQTPVAPRSKSNSGNLDWIELYKVPVKQVLYIQDGNMWKTYPYINEITKYVRGGAGTQLCAYNTLERLPIPRAFIPPPQIDIAKRIALADKRTKERDGWLCLQTFKAWKHVDSVVRAIPYMDDYSKLLAGGGIEQRYMTSKTKVKDHYRVVRSLDPDCALKDRGRPIWDVAVEHGMDYLGFISSVKRDKLLLKVKALLDPSWSQSYVNIGGDYFNRTAAEAAILGTALIAVDIAIGPNGYGTLYKAEQNYLPISHEASPLELGELINTYMSPEFNKTRIRTIEKNRETLPIYEPTYAAQAFIDLAKGKEAGYFKINAPGKRDPVFVAEGTKVMKELFGGEKKKPKRYGFLTTAKRR